MIKITCDKGMIEVETSGPPEVLTAELQIFSEQAPNIINKITENLARKLLSKDLFADFQKVAEQIKAAKTPEEKKAITDKAIAEHRQMLEDEEDDEDDCSSDKNIH